MFTENTLDQNLMAVVGEVEMPQEEATQVLGITFACYTFNGGCHTHTC